MLTRKRLSARKVREKFGISDMTLWRWINDPALEFPKPDYINGRRYFDDIEIDVWDRKPRPRRAIEAV